MKTGHIIFRVTDSERKMIDEKRGNATITEYLLRLVRQDSEDVRMAKANAKLRKDLEDYCKAMSQIGNKAVTRPCERFLSEQEE